MVLAGCEHDEVCSGTYCGAPGIDSRFQPQDEYAREVAGRVRLGTELARGAIVHIDVAPGLADDARWNGGDLATVTTNDFGLYRFTNAPLFYDLTIRSGLDVLVMRDLGQRYVEPPLDAQGAAPAFTAHVDLVADPPPADGQKVAFFVSGDDAVDVSGRIASGLDVLVRGFSSPITLHVVAYDAQRSLTAAIAYGKVDVRVQANAPTPAHVTLAPITTFAQFVVAPKADPGVVETGSELAMDFGVRTSARPITTVGPGRQVVLAAVPGARYLMRTHGANGAALSDSGLYAVDTTQSRIVPTLPAPPTLEAPSPGALADPALVASGSGVLEHVLVPDDRNAPTLHIVTRERAVVVPDLSHVGLAKPTGKHTWTVRSWPSLKTEDEVSGADVRTTIPSALSEPRAVVLP